MSPKKDTTKVTISAKGMADIHTTTDEMAKTAERIGGIGHNVDGVTSPARLKSFVQRIERLNEDKLAIGEDLKEVYAEAKGTGYDTKIIRKIVTIRKMDVEKRREQEELLELYKSALGMVD